MGVEDVTTPSTNFNLSNKTAFPKKQKQNLLCEKQPYFIYFIYYV